MSQLFNDCLSKRALLDFIAKGPYLNVIAKKLYWLSKQDTYISNMFKRHWNLLCGFRPFFPKRTYLIKPKNIQRWAIMVPHSNKNELYAKTYLLQRSRNIPYHTYPSASWYMNILGCTYLHVPHIPIVYLLYIYIYMEVYVCMYIVGLSHLRLPPSGSTTVLVMYTSRVFDLLNMNLTHVSEQLISRTTWWQE